MNRLLNKTAKFVLSPQKTILSSAVIIAGMIIISRIFGFVRYRALASYFTKEQLDLFFAAFRLPDFIYEILISGAFGATFVPIFIKYEHNKTIFKIAISSILNALFFILGISVIILFIFADYCINIIAPGLSIYQKETVIVFSRILLLTQLPLLILGSVISGIGQSEKRFLLSSLAPVLYNIGIIFGTIFFSSSYGLFGPLLGVIIGSLLFVIVQLPLLSISKISFQMFLYKAHYIKEFVSLYIPRILTVISTQVDLTVDLALATLLGPGNYTIFYFAQHLSLFPVSVVGMSFGQAALPYLTELYNQNRLEHIKNIVIESMLQMLFVSIPLSFFFTFARTPLIRFFYGGEQFDWNGTVQTAITLSFFALSIPSHTIFYFLVRIYYALRDTKTPFVISTVSVMINITFSFIFVYFLKMPVWSLGLSFTISIYTNIVLLLLFINLKLKGFNIQMLLKNSIKIFISSLLASIPSYTIIKLFDGLIFDTTRTINVIFLLSASFIMYVLIYLLTCWFISVEELNIIKKIMLKADNLKTRIFNYYTDIG